MMNYKIYRSKNELDSTGYMEIGPGTYSGEHWQEGFLFIWEDAFGMAEGIVMKHFPKYDHLDMNDIPRNVGELIIKEWYEAASTVVSSQLNIVQEVLNLNAVYHAFMGEEIEPNRENISLMLRELAHSCEDFYKQNSWICILGV